MMRSISEYPLQVPVFSMLLMWLAVQFGHYVSRLRPTPEDQKDDLRLVTNASLTLLALIIGFSFSMAVHRYDQRKDYEEDEANAIGTEYVRVGLMPAAEASKVRTVLRNYLDQRLLFYTVTDWQQLEQIDAETASLQSEMWSFVQDAAIAQPVPTMALTVSGMNDVLNRQGYARAAWWNHIPAGAWALMAALALCCCALIGYGSHRKGGILIVFLPFIISIAFFLIADIDSPRRGVIRVRPQNLVSLSQSLPTH
jgi:hypothetical protein